MASWFSYLAGDQKSSSTLPPVTALQEQRAKQISSLQNLNPNVVELKAQTEYRIPITHQGHNIALRIFLPPQFPQDKPIVSVTPPVRHPWVSPTMEVVGCPGLVSFGVHTDLGRVVQDIVREFNRNPPMVFPPASNQQPQMNNYPPYPPDSATSQVMPQPSSSFQPMPTLSGPPQNTYAPPFNTAGPSLGVPPSSNSISHIDFPQSVEASEEASHTKSTTETDHAIFVNSHSPPPFLQGPSNSYQLPDIEDSFSVLGDMSSEQLQLILDDERKFMELFESMPGLKKFYEQRTELYRICQELAKKNLSYKPELEKRKERVRELEQEQVDLNETFHQQCLKQQALNKQCDPQLLLDNIRVAAADAECSSDSLAEDFLEGKLPLDDFLKQYSEKRTKFHLRKVKEEKLMQMLSDRSLRY